MRYAGAVGKEARTRRKGAAGKERRGKTGDDQEKRKTRTKRHRIVRSQTDFTGTSAILYFLNAVLLAAPVEL